MSTAGDIGAASAVLQEAERGVAASSAFAGLPPERRRTLQTDLERIRRALSGAPHSLDADPYASAALAAAFDQGTPGDGEAAANAATGAGGRPLLRAVSQLPAAAGAAADELDFASFVSSLVHGVFDSIVDSSIRQMEAFARLVASLAQDVESFSRQNITRNQVRDWLHEQHGNDLALELPDRPGAQPRLLPRASAEEDGGFAPSPAWLDDYGLAGEGLSDELIERRLIPAARRRMGEERMRTLATMVLMGVNRVKVDRGEISARIRIRAAAADSATVDFATAQDSPQQQSGWGARSGFLAARAQPTAMVSTTLNAQADGSIAAELLGEVRISFSSETLPLERFADEAARVLLERAARRPAPAPARLPLKAEDAELLPLPSDPGAGAAADAPPPRSGGGDA